MSQQVKAIWFKDFARECDTVKTMSHVLAALPSVSGDEYCDVCNCLRDLMQLCFDLLDQKGYNYNAYVNRLENSEGQILNMAKIIQPVDEFNREMQERMEKLIDDPLDDFWKDL